MSCPSRAHPLRFRGTVEFAHRPFYEPILTKFDLGTRLAPKMRPNALPIPRNKCIQLDKVRNAFRDVLQSPCDNKAAI